MFVLDRKQCNIPAFCNNQAFVWNINWNQLTSKMRAAEIYGAFTLLRLWGSRVGWLYGKDPGSDLEVIISLGLLGPLPMMSLEFSCMMSRMVLKILFFFSLSTSLFIPFDSSGVTSYHFVKLNRHKRLRSAGIFPHQIPRQSGVLCSWDRVRLALFQTQQWASSSITAETKICNLL